MHQSLQGPGLATRGRHRGNAREHAVRHSGEGREDMDGRAAAAFHPGNEEPHAITTPVTRQAAAPHLPTQGGPDV